MKALMKLAGMGPGWQRRTLICILGILGQGFFLSFLIDLGLGTDPFTYMNVSISDRIGWTFGNWQLTLNLILLILVLLTSRLRYLGIGTIANMVLIGYIADFCRMLWARWIPEKIFTNPSSRFPLFALTLALFIVACSIYMNSDMGLAPYDAPPVIFCRKFSKLPFFTVRIVWDCGAILIGTLAGGRPPIACLIMAVALGPVISAVGAGMKKLFPGLFD